MITATVTNAAKLAWLESCSGDVFRAALYGPDARISETTGAYTPDGEIRGQGYETGGKILTGYMARLVNGIAIADFEDVSWNPSTLEARYLLIYNDSKPGKPTLQAIDFGKVFSSENGPFTYRFPVPDAQHAMTRIS